MILNEKVINYNVVYLIEIYNFGFGYVSIRVYLNNSKIFELQNISMVELRFLINCRITKL